MFKKLLVTILAVVMTLAMSVNVFASTNSDSSEYKEYLGYKQEGILGEEVTFDVWKNLKEQSQQLELMLEDSENFSEVPLTKSYSMKKGDVFITNGTSSAGILGHAAIAISTSKIIHIANNKSVPEVISLSDWFDLYEYKGWTKIYRSSNSTVASAAGNWARDTYEDSNVPYVINTNLASTDETYCSKMVWQAYYYGVDGEHHANGPTFGYRLPYDLPDTIHDLSFQIQYDKK